MTSSSRLSSRLVFVQLVLQVTFKKGEGEGGGSRQVIYESCRPKGSMEFKFFIFIFDFCRHSCMSYYLCPTRCFKVRGHFSIQINDSFRISDVNESFPVLCTLFSLTTVKISISRVPPLLCIMF